MATASEQSKEQSKESKDAIATTIRTIKEHIGLLCANYNEYRANPPAGREIFKEKLSINGFEAMKANHWGLPEGRSIGDEIVAANRVLRALREVQLDERDIKETALAIKHLLHTRDRQEVEQFASSLAQPPSEPK